MKIIKNLFYCFLLLNTIETNAQVFINESFKNQTTTAHVVKGGVAKFTSGDGDSSGNGWLRLTNTENSKHGYAFINEAFPSDLGTITEFEYKAWRNKSDKTNGDGFTVFLFDGSVNENTFRIGAYGGSLGYTKNSAVTPAVPNGLRGGYLAVGFDSYGGFGNSTEGKNGPDIPRDVSNSDLTPNTIVLRGATNETDPTKSNLILAYKKMGTRSNKTIGELQSNGKLSYKDYSPSRPSDDLFFRKVKIEVVPEVNNNVRQYRIKVYLIENKNATYSSTPDINYLSTQKLPETLKIGFAASTGGAVNFHEIRNLKITTVGNLSVINSTENKTICRESRNEDVEINIKVNNPENTILNNIQINNQFFNNKNNTLLDNNSIEITSIEYSSNISNTNFTRNTANFGGSFSLAKSSIGTIKVKAKIKQPNIEIKNIVTVDSNLTDSDLSNNTSSEIISRKICTVNTNPMIYIKSE